MATVACHKVTEKGKWTSKPANATTVIYNSTKPGQGSTPGGQSAPAQVTINRVELNNRLRGESVYDPIGTDTGTGLLLRLTPLGMRQFTVYRHALIVMETHLSLVLRVLYLCLMNVKLR